MRRAFVGRRIIAFAITALASAALVVSASPASAQLRGVVPNEKVRIVPPAKPCIYKVPDITAICENPTTQRVASFVKLLLAPLRLPKPVWVQFAECGGREVAHYVPAQSEATATICYEALMRIERALRASESDPREIAKRRRAPYIMTAMRAIAPAIFDVLNVPVWGRLDDAADRLTAFVMLQFGEDFAKEAILGSAQYLSEIAEDWTTIKFSSTSSPEFQRMFNYLCVAYGGAPETFAGPWQGIINFWDKKLAEQVAQVPADKKAAAEKMKEAVIRQIINRQIRCLGPRGYDKNREYVNYSEYEQVRNAFYARIMPYVDPDMMVLLRGFGGSVTEAAN